MKNGLLRSAGVAGLMLAAITSAPVIAQSALTPEQLTIRVEQMGQSTKRTEDALKTIQSQMKKLSGDVERQGRLVDNRAVLDMIQQVDDLAGEVSQLNGAIEEQGHAIDDIKKRQRELYLDIDRRLRDLESRATTQAPASSVSLPGVAASTSAATPETTVEAASGSETAASIEPASTGGSSAALVPSATTATQSEEKAAYQAAFDTLKEGRYKKAKTEFKAFLAKYPNGSFSGNAQYWLGEAHYVPRYFDQGIVVFEKVLKMYPSSNKVPDAMLKLGYTFYELKQFPKAKSTLQLLRERFPKATAARLAAKRLDRIRKEGH
jgi:tol-pal system protein YbgF